MTVPAGKPLKDRLDAIRGRVAPILISSEGSPWTEDGFRSSWGKGCKLVGIVGVVTFNDLRGTAITRLALAECTEAEIATVKGHRLRDVRSNLIRDIRLG